MTNKNASFPAPPHGRFIAHRGVPSMVPENSLEGFQLAIKLGFNWIEFDIQITQDNEFIIFHDDHLERTSTGTGCIRDLNLHQIQQYTLKNRNKLKNLTIPTLSDTLKLLNTYPNITANIELKLPEKVSETKRNEIRSKLFTNFVTYSNLHLNFNAQNTPMPIVSSFDHDILIQLRAVYPTLPLGFLVEEPNKSHLALAKLYAPASINAHFTFLTPSFLTLATKQNTRILAYTVNNLDKARELLNWGVYALFTDQLRISDIP